MATESAIRIPSLKEAAFSPTTRNVSIEDLGLLRTPTFTIPNRSGSAPPNMEGSFLAVNNLISQQNSSRNQRVGNTAHYFELDKQSNTAYHGTNVNPASRLPTPPISKENRSPGHHFDKFGGNRRASVDSSCRSSFQPQATLSTHKEESEDDRSIELPSDDRNDRTNRRCSSEDAGSWSGQTKSSVDTIQEDFPRTPSPLFNQSHSLSSVTTDEPADNDGDSSSLHDYPVSVSSVAVSKANIDSVRPPLCAELSSASVASTSSLNYTSYSQLPPLVHKGNLTISNLASIESGMNNLAIFGPRIANQDQWHQSYQRNIQQSQVYQQQNTPFQLHGAKSQIGSQGAVSPYIGMDQYFHGTHKFSTEVQPVLQSSGFTPPLYTTAAAYMTAQNPYYANLQASGIYHQQYGTSGYPSSSGVVPPYMTGYPHATYPVVYDGPTGPNFSGRVSAPPTGPLGYAVGDPSYMQYYHQPFGQVYNITGQFDPLMSGSVYGSQNIFTEAKKGVEFVPGLDDHKSQTQKSGPGNHNHVRGGVINPHYPGNQPNMGPVMQYPPPPLAASVLPGSASSGAMFSGGRSDTRVPPVTGRYTTVYSGWQGQREADSFNEPKIYNFLEELKSGKGRRFELSDIAGHIVEFSTDQHGSRFIQQKLESCSAEEKAAVFKEVLPYAAKLMTDVFGNYVIQKFFEYGSTDQRRELANQLGGQILPLSLQMYGCRVIQKALDVIELDQKAQLIQELDGHVMRCVRDQNGNHVIQKCIESITAEKIGFIIAAFRGQVATLSTHPYGCRVVQRVLEHCTDDLHFQFIVDEILESVYSLSQDQYGNYVTQHVLERGKPHERFQIVSRLSGHIVQLSQHKFASNVIEKCLEYGGPNERGLIFDEVLGQTEGNDNLLIMMKDQYANYVVQKILDTCTPSQQLLLLNRIRPHVHALKKYTYGKHIVGRFEQQFGEDQAP